MKRLRNGFGAAVLLGVLAAGAAAADLEGYLVDQMCSGEVMTKGANAAKGHTRDCALMDHCRESGYGVLTSEGKYLKFDAQGNKRAVQALKASKKKDDLRVRVSGEVNGETIKVASLKIL